MIIAVFIATMLIGIGIGLPIAMALLLCAVCTALAMGGGDANPTIIARTLMQGSDSVTMMALPFFVLAGEIMNRGGLTSGSSPSAMSSWAASGADWAMSPSSPA